MSKVTNTILATIGVLCLTSAVVFCSARTGHASGGPVVVQVTGTTATSDVNNPAFQPVQFYLLPHSPLTPGGAGSDTATATFQVPLHKELVIDYISSQAQDLGGGAAGLTIGTTVGGNFISYIVYVDKNDNNAVNQSTAIYADPGTVVQAFAFNAAHTPASCGGLVNCSGHYVNVP